MDTATTATPLNVCESEDPHFDKEEVFALPPAYDPSAGRVPDVDPMMGYPPPLGFLPEAMAQLMPPMGDLRVNMMPYSLPEPAADSGYSGYDPTGSAIPAAAVPQRATQVAGQPNAPVIANLLKVASSNENASEE
ncbi:hypothetical protein FOZ61_007945 [Perkinsus olseni]|uniref:Uncharacterized protein n=1 Tax=Perkinsus olseni TaxID=32597 RepID=A0A7J6M8D7_PEROL|nr:hypothetical protein FOZ61_007945 [Perkinsus olseni]